MPAVFPKVLCGLHTARGAPGTRISLPNGKGSELQRAAGRWARFNPAAVQSQRSAGADQRGHTMGTQELLQE